MSERVGQPVPDDGARPGPGRAGSLRLAIGLLGAGGLVVALGLATQVMRSGPDRPAEERGMGSRFRGHVLPQPMPKPAFTLTDTEGQSFDFRAETRGKLALLFFGYTHCPDVCPVHIANLAAVLAELLYEVRSQIRVVFVTADPARDTPERLRDWLGQFAPRFVGLRGGLGEVNGILSELRLGPVVHGEPDASGDYVVGHPAQIFAFTPDGRLRVVYPFGTRQVDWAHDLPKLLGFGARAADATAQGFADPAASATPDASHEHSRGSSPSPAHTGN